jgi:hypothetical protein
MTHDDKAHEVQARMARLRRELDNDVQHVADSAKAMTDWTFYVRRFPWAAVGIAAAAGYLLVPRKRTTITPTAEQLAALLKNKQFVAAAADQLQPPPSVLKGVAGTLLALAGRAALAYVSEQIRAKAAGPRQEPVTPTARST